MGKEFMGQIVTELIKPNPNYRLPKSEGHEIAKEYLVNKLKELKLAPGNKGEWLQPIYEIDNKVIGENIIGILPGKSEEYILLLAHYDTFELYNGLSIPGANDNAAAIAIILETIKQLPQWNGTSNIMVLISDLEEPPYFLTENMGSTYFYKHCPIDTNNISCAIVLDLVGHDIPYKPLKDALFITGAESSNMLLNSVVSASSNSEGISVHPIRNEVIPDLSDYHIFRINRRPFLFLSCGIVNYHYHRHTDTIDVLNFDKMLHTSDFIKKLILHLDSSGNPPTSESNTKDPNRNPPSLDNSRILPPYEKVMDLEAELYSSLLNKKVSSNRYELDNAANKIMSLISRISD